MHNITSTSQNHALTISHITITLQDVHHLTMPILHYITLYPPSLNYTQLNNTLPKHNPTRHHVTLPTQDFTLQYFIILNLTSAIPHLTIPILYTKIQHSTLPKHSTALQHHYNITVHLQILLVI